MSNRGSVRQGWLNQVYRMRLEIQGRMQRLDKSYNHAETEDLRLEIGRRENELQDGLELLDQVAVWLASQTDL